MFTWKPSFIQGPIEMKYVVNGVYMETSFISGPNRIKVFT